MCYAVSLFLNWKIVFECLWKVKAKHTEEMKLKWQWGKNLGHYFTVIQAAVFFEQKFVTISGPLYLLLMMLLIKTSWQSSSHSHSHFFINPLWKLVPTYHSLTQLCVFFICDDLGFSSIYLMTFFNINLF